MFTWYRSDFHPGTSSLRFPLMALGAFHSTKYSGLKFRVFHATNGTVFSGSLDYPISGHQASSFARKYEIKRMALLPLFTCFGVARRLWSWNKQCIMWGSQYHFYRKNLKGVRDYIYGTSLFSWRVQESISNDERAVHSSGAVMLTFYVALYFRTTH